jgi:hypothetical protein
MFGSGTGSFEEFEMTTTTTTARQPGENVPWYSRPAQDVLALSLPAPAVVATDKLIQLSRRRKARTGQSAELTPTGS